jgi:hypothetical protein
MRRVHDSRDADSVCATRFESWPRPSGTVGRQGASSATVFPPYQDADALATA